MIISFIDTLLEEAYCMLEDPKFNNMLVQKRIEILFKLKIRLFEMTSSK